MPVGLFGESLKPIHRKNVFVRRNSQKKVFVTLKLEKLARDLGRLLLPMTRVLKTILNTSAMSDDVTMMWLANATIFGNLTC